MRTSLVVSAGKKAALSIKIKPGISLIGRSRRCQVRPKTRSVSRRHCAIICSDEKVWIQDLGSHLGTLVNDVRLSPDRKRRLRDGDQISLGKAKFAVQVCEVQPSWGRGDPSEFDANDLASDSGDDLDVATADRSVSPEPFDEMDLAALLDELDEADRKERIDKIQSDHRRRKEAEEAELAAMLSDDFESSDSDTDSEIGTSEEPNSASSIDMRFGRPSSDQAAAKGLRQILTGVIEETPEREKPRLRSQLEAEQRAAQAAAEEEGLFGDAPETPMADLSPAERKKKAKADRALAKRIAKAKRKQARAAQPSMLQRLGSQDNHWWTTRAIILAVVVGLGITSYSIYSNLIHDPRTEHALFQE
ncbi:FHA domain protein [Rosistilla carotiformis]|uniref:FHA domain protein n=1 Tax=Rosistilla carotiformis TaxID=2528017 RepID=A0A518JPM6_9BACT|nr:FHA domain-containing protein [Rosistilla carotiformis]QDV67499.1 FHA domain protein [Rosistilla carotiformis]